MAQTIPQTMKALITQADKTARVQEVPVPQIDDDEVLVKVVAIAQNPADWKLLEFLTHANTICGCDWSGYVVQTGKAVSSPAIGDHVAGFVHGGAYEDRGAFAEFVKTPAELTWKVPEGTITHEEAATLGGAYWAAVQSLFHPTRLGLIEPPNKVDKEEWVLVYGGSGSVGLFAIQLAHAAGYKVVTTASPRNHELVKSLGADAVFDYHDPSSISKIKQLTRNALSYGLDAIATPDAQKFSVQTFGTTAGGKLVTVQPAQDEAKALRPDVKIHTAGVYTTLGKPFELGGTQFAASPEDRAHMVQFLKKTPGLVKSGQVKANPTTLLAGGLEGVPAGFQVMKEGRNSGEKIVYRVSN